MRPAASVRSGSSKCPKIRAMLPGEVLDASVFFALPIGAGRHGRYYAWDRSIQDLLMTAVPTRRRASRGAGGSAWIRWRAAWADCRARLRSLQGRPPPIGAATGDGMPPAKPKRLVPFQSNFETRQVLDSLTANDDTAGDSLSIDLDVMMQSPARFKYLSAPQVPLEDVLAPTRTFVFSDTGDTQYILDRKWDPFRHVIRKPRV